MTKPITVVKMPYKLLYIIQLKGFLIKDWPYWPGSSWMACIRLVSSYITANKPTVQLKCNLIYVGRADMAFSACLHVARILVYVYRPICPPKDNCNR